jgi:hypothetical protein
MFLRSIGRLTQTPYNVRVDSCPLVVGCFVYEISGTRAGRTRFSNHKLNKSGGGRVERLINVFSMIMKKILFALTMFALAFAALTQARGDDVSTDFFYDNLSGGNWIEVGGYGYGWQPDVAVSDPNWRPYADGYWAYTDYGWTWISYEDFGWATYHYGRWANLADYGWVWFPGSDLEWGPAWVSWRTGGDYIGWAPLPPRGPDFVYEGQPIGANVDVVFDIGPEYYNFCDIRFIGEPVLRDRIFPRVQNVTYITNTVNVTNITVQNNVVYNYGPNYNVINQYSSRPIQRLTIERETSSNLSTAVKSGTLTKVQGNKLLVAAPQKIAKAPPSVKPPAVKARVEQPKIQHGWKGVPNEAGLKERIKNQNPKDIPPPTRAAAREAGSPAPALGTSPAGAGGAPAAPPGPREKRGRAAPGATAAGSSGGSPAPFERGKSGGRSRPDVTPPKTEPREGASTSPFEPRQGRGKPSGRSIEPGPEGGATGAAKATPTSRFQGRTSPSEHGRSPRREPGEESNPEQGRAGQIPPQEREREPQREQFGTPPPAGAGERGQRGGGPQPGFGRPVTPPGGGQPAGEARGQKERTQGVHGQPPSQRGGAPAGVERGQRQGQPEGGKRKPEKGTPRPRPQ